MSRLSGSPVKNSYLFGRLYTKMRILIYVRGQRWSIFDRYNINIDGTDYRRDRYRYLYIHCDLKRIFEIRKAKKGNIYELVLGVPFWIVIGDLLLIDCNLAENILE